MFMHPWSKSLVTKPSAFVLYIRKICTSASFFPFHFHADFWGGHTLVTHACTRDSVPSRACKAGSHDTNHFDLHCFQLHSCGNNAPCCLDKLQNISTVLGELKLFWGCSHSIPECMKLDPFPLVYTNNNNNIKKTSKNSETGTKGVRNRKKNTLPGDVGETNDAKKFKKNNPSLVPKDVFPPKSTMENKKKTPKNIKKHQPKKQETKKNQKCVFPFPLSSSLAMAERPLHGYITPTVLGVTKGDKKVAT